MSGVVHHDDEGDDERRTVACGAHVTGNIFLREGLESLRYPVGRFEMRAEPDEGRIALAVREIADLPEQLRVVTGRLGDKHLDRTYREGGWTARQVVHHLADAHINAYVRLRLALTEDEPLIKPYDDSLWAELTDARALAVEDSLSILKGLHARWAALLGALSPREFARTFRHPERGVISIARQTAFYAWHGRHHTAHIALIASH